MIGRQDPSPAVHLSLPGAAHVPENVIDHVGGCDDVDAKVGQGLGGHGADLAYDDGAAVTKLIDDVAYVGLVFIACG